MRVFYCDACKKEIQEFGAVLERCSPTSTKKNYRLDLCEKCIDRMTKWIKTWKADRATDKDAKEGK